MNNGGGKRIASARSVIPGAVLWDLSPRAPAIGAAAVLTSGVTACEASW